MARTTPLHERHAAAGARMVDFAGWDMPLHYGSQLGEHKAVREAAGMFDVSHMTQVEIRGTQATDFLRHALANDVAGMDDGKALYSCLLNDDGGVVDDGIVYRLGEGLYRLVINAATRDKDLAWLERIAADFAVDLRERDDLAMLAVQGPEARERVHAVLTGDLVEHARALGRFRLVTAGQTGVARTGYTGEDGYEIMLPGPEAVGLWDSLLDAGVRPAGLGARDTLRLEAGMPLYGHEMDEETSPLVAGLAWTIAWEPADRAFRGRAALERERAAGVDRHLVGLSINGRGVARAQQVVSTAAGDGRVTSGGFSPLINGSIALARVPVDVGPGDEVTIDMRGRPVGARVVRYPFVRGGRVVVE